MRTGLGRAAVILAWIVIWGGTGWIVGYREHSHARQVLPFLGVLYGMTAGIVFAVLQTSRLACDRARLTRSIGLGVLASLATIPAVWPVVGGLPPALLAFFPMAGAVTGVATIWILPSGDLSSALEDD
ncbi:MAG TPA: hypothetical protein VFH27_09290 [Longimicrobiaceae bacterium]|nr:hypothetical protein [Longimicrobiaceae bacterium]